MKKYDFRKIEKHWQEKWLEEGIYEPDLKSAKKPFYNLMMFPYPSAEGLHVGNMYAFTGADIYGRLKRMQGYDVFEPIGLDGFGIHSENYALKIGAHPMRQAKVSERRFYKQLRMIGNGFAWKERLQTYSPEYYRWTQWIFTKLFNAGLAYRKKQAVNWCPSCKTVLADEQVLSGKCERCGTTVIKKELEQWFFRITKYAEKLLKNLEKLDWSEKVKIAQKNWIGKSEGALIDFKIQDSKFKIRIFTTRPDTLFGATYMVLAPEHPLIEKLGDRIKNLGEIKNYIKKAKTKSEEERIMEGREKTGVELKGIKATNPATEEEIPVWVADYVLTGYGTGAIMAVPAHDYRDFEFAKKYKLPVREVIEPLIINSRGPNAVREDMPFTRRNAVVCIVKHWAEEKYLCLKWKKIDWRGFVIGGIEDGEDIIEAGRREIQEETGYRNLKFIKKLGGIIHSQFYHVLKNENRWAHFSGLYFELKNGEAFPVSEKEKEIHDILWLTPKEVETFMNVEDTRLFWERLHKKAEVFTGDGILVNSGKFSGMASEKAKWEITKFVAGERKTQYRLRDWLISRQRYWGPPIPMIFCENCAARIKADSARLNPEEDADKSGKNIGINQRPPAGASSVGEWRTGKYQHKPVFTKGELENPGWIAVPEDKLPVKLPFIKDFRPTGKGTAPLATHAEFYKTKCPKCGGEARRETDVSDTFLDSAWYYLGYLAKDDSRFTIRDSRFSRLAKKWLPVDMYIGGAEHSVLHLLYVRFLALALHDLKLLEFGRSPAPEGEPFPKFRAHGLLISEGAKMSKSKGNVVNPDEYLKNFGADVLRMYLMFLAPFEQGGDFRDAGIAGPERFLIRVYGFFKQNKDKLFPKHAELPNKATRQELAKTIKKVTEDIERLSYNTAISKLMTLLYYFEAANRTNRGDAEDFLKLLAPFAPHITEEIWHEFLGKKTSIHKEKWPIYNPDLIKEETFTLVIQVNGKVRDNVAAPLNIKETEARKLALGRERIKRFLGQKEPKRIIYVPNRLVNIVI